LALGRALEVWVVEGAIPHQGPQDTQELVHQDTQCLHLDKGILLPCLKLQILTGEGILHLHQVHHGKEQSGAQTRPSLVRHRRSAARLASRCVQDRLGPSQLDQLTPVNVRRDLGRTALTSCALMMGLTMVVGFGAFSASGMVELERYTDSFNVDLFVYGPRPLRLSLGDQLATVEGVERVMPASSIQTERVPPPDDPNGARDTLTYTAIDVSWYEEVPMLFAAGQGDPQPMLDRLAQGDAVFTSPVLAERYGLDKGDTIRLRTPTGERDFLVAGVAINYAGYGYGVFGPWKDARRYFHDRNANNFDLRLAPSASVQEVRQRIEERFGKRYHLHVGTLEEFQGRLLAYAEETMRYLDVFVLIGLIIAALGVLNTLLVNVLEASA
jgi:putative ABC transport system permease protein